MESGITPTLFGLLHVERQRGVTMQAFRQAKFSPASVWDYANRVTWTVPTSPVSINIPVLWKILDQVVGDWHLAAEEHQMAGSAESDEKRLSFLTNAIESVKPRFIQCLFSYISFFFMLENGYHFIYSELNELNMTPALRLPHRKPPEQPEFIENLWAIRNYSIAHWAGTEQKKRIDSAAGRGWGMCFSASDATGWDWDIEKLQLGNIRICREDENAGITERSFNLGTKSIPEMHIICTSYLGEFDEVCTEYLDAIKSRLPMTIDGRRIV
jgi:hypothetical protein